MTVKVQDGTVAALVCVAARLVGWEKAREMLCPQLAGLKGSEIFDAEVRFSWDANGNCTGVHHLPPSVWFKGWASKAEVERWYNTGEW